MEWKKHQRKQEIEWNREDIQFYSKCYNEYVELYKKHCEKHGGKFDKSCKRCALWKEMIINARDIVAKSKQNIREVLRGER